MTTHFPQRVLLVEDHPDHRESLRMVLQLWGHQVAVARDGPEGVRKALAWQPEVAIVDVGLPGLDGYQVARRVRAALRDGALLIALSAYAEPEDGEGALAQEFDVHLAKPAELSRLARLVERGVEPFRNFHVLGKTAGRGQGEKTARHRE
jgi:CheY-like chemotaxis protein